jgi:hypothetical protein
MGCVASYFKPRKGIQKFKRHDLRINIPLSCEGPYLKTLSRDGIDGTPGCVVYKNESVKTTFPKNILGYKKFMNELAAYKLLKNESFIQYKYDINNKDYSFASHVTYDFKFDMNLINKVNEIISILENKYGLIPLEEYNIYNDISINGSLIYLNNLANMPIKYNVMNSWKYNPYKKYSCFN